MTRTTLVLALSVLAAGCQTEVADRAAVDRMLDQAEALLLDGVARSDSSRTAEVAGINPSLLEGVAPPESSHPHPTLQMDRDNPAPLLVVVEPIDRPTVAQVLEALEDLAMDANCPPHELVIGASAHNELRLAAVDAEGELSGTARLKLTPTLAGIGWDAAGPVWQPSGSMTALLEGAWYQAAPFGGDGMGRFFLDFYALDEEAPFPTGEEVLGVSRQLDSGLRLAVGFSTLCDDG